MSGLAGKVALVADGGNPIGRAVALSLSARGVRVLVAGLDERKLGETVGEVVYGGGKARHFPLESLDEDRVKAAAARAREVFEVAAVDVIVLSNATLVGIAAKEVAEGGSVVVVAKNAPSLAEESKRKPHQLRANAVVVDDAFVASDSDEVGELVAFVCASRLHGRVLSLA